MDNTLFSTAMMMLDKLMPKVREEDYSKPTPCSEWDVRALTNHLLNELAWIAPLLEGKTISEVGSALDGDLIKGDAEASWQKYCEQASEQMSRTDPKSTAHLSYSDKSAQAYVDEVSADIIIHGWDLAQALGIDYEIDNKTAAAVREATKQIMPSGRSSGYVGPELEVGADASEQDKLLAYYGRSTNWKK